MPHVTVRMYSGRTEEDKARLAQALTRAVVDSLGYKDDVPVSVAIEDVDPGVWMAQVYEPEISDKPDTLYKRPGYGPAAG